MRRLGCATLALAAGMLLAIAACNKNIDTKFEDQMNDTIRGLPFVGNDSGPAHMAAALRRPSVVIFGSMSPKIWGPWPPHGSGRYVQNPFACNPCPGYQCHRFERPECILSVTVEQVIETIRRVLA